MAQAAIARVILVPMQNNIDIANDLTTHPTIKGWGSTGLASIVQIKPIQAYHQGVFEWLIEIVIVTTTAGNATIVAGLSALATALGVASLETWSHQVTYG